MTKETRKVFICRQAMKHDGEQWIWQKGRAGAGTVSGVEKGELLEVSISPAAGEVGGRYAWHVLVCVAGVLCWEDWKPTPEAAARWAEKKLWAIFNVIGGAR